MIFLTDYRTAATERAELIDDILYPQKVHWFPETYKNVASGVVYPPHKLAQKVLDSKLIEDIKNRPGKTAFILASGNGHLAGLNSGEKKSKLWYDYKVLPMTLTQVYAGRVAQMMGIKDLVMTDASACASSLKVMMDVQSLVMMYGFHRVVVLSFEDAVSNLVLQFFGEAQASLPFDSLALPSAFDSQNYGFHVGQGAVLAVFETDLFAHRAAAKLVSAYSASEDSSNAIGQREDGEGFVKAMVGAMDARQVNRKDITIIKTHGTGTASNNAAEKNAIKTALGKNAIATSFKPTIGHTMGASGLLETCLLLDALKQTGNVPAIKNRTEDDDVFISKDTKPQSGMIMSLAAGMGNIYSAAIFDPRV